MGAMQRRKGAVGEREIVNLHKAQGIHAERVVMSGAIKGRRMGDGHDVDIYARGPHAAPMVCEVKRGKQVPKFIRDALGDNDALFMRRDREDWVVVLPMRIWFDLIRARA